MVTTVKESEKFTKSVQKLDKSYLNRVEKLIIKIKEDPEIGKPMRYGGTGTREVYIRPFRLSYAFDKKNDVLYLLDIYHKDKQ